MRYILLYIALLAAGLSCAQSPRYRSTNGISNKKNYDRKARQPLFMTVRTGLTQFYGELNAQAMHGMAGLGGGLWFNKQFGAELDFHAGKIGGEKVAFFNSYFENEYNSVECIVKWDLSEQFSRNEPGLAHVILFAGLGQIWFSAHAFDLDDNRLLRFTNSAQSAFSALGTAQRTERNSENKGRNFTTWHFYGLCIVQKVENCA